MFQGNAQRNKHEEEKNDCPGISNKDNIKRDFNNHHKKMHSDSPDKFLEKSLKVRNRVPIKNDMMDGY